MTVVGRPLKLQQADVVDSLLISDAVSVPVLAQLLTIKESTAKVDDTDRGAQKKQHLSGTSSNLSVTKQASGNPPQVQGERSSPVQVKCRDDVIQLPCHKAVHQHCVGVYVIQEALTGPLLHLLPCALPCPCTPCALRGSSAEPLPTLKVLIAQQQQKWA